MKKYKIYDWQHIETGFRHNPHNSKHKKAALFFEKSIDEMIRQAPIFYKNFETLMPETEQ